jgi:hypothetical protein
MDPGTDGRIRGILARSRVTDWEGLQATACYQEDACQLDGNCPFLAGCKRAEAETSGG